MEINKLEEIVLSTLLVDGSEAVGKVSKLLTPADFSFAPNRELFLGLLDLHRTNRPIESSLLSDRNRNHAIEVGNQTLPRKENFQHFVQQVKEASELRKLHSVLRLSLESVKGKTAAQLAEEVGKSMRGFRPMLDSTKDVFVDFERLVSTIPNEIDWMVDGVIERGANGIIAGVPKASKSWVAADLGLSVALGTPWMGFGVTRPAKVALISREDNPGLTSWRLRALAKSKASTADLRLLKSNFIVNTRQQSDSLLLDDPKDVQEILELLSRHRVELAIFDVLNVLHRKDENDNKEMREILQQLSNIQQASRCAIAVVHHFNKMKDGSWTERLRGSSAISGWVEWLIGVTMAEEESKVRRLEFELKASEPPNPIHYQIQTEGQMAWLKLCEEPTNGKKRASSLIK